MQRPFRFGVVNAYAPSGAAWIETARKAEELGYSTLLMPDRIGVGSLSPFPALAVAATATTKLRVGSYVFCNDYRHPVLLAREAATLDLLSGGRLELGLGAGVSAEDFQQMGIPFDSAGVRIGRLEETLQITKLLFSEETVNFAGKYYTISDLKGNTKPLQKPRIPLMVAGTGEKMLKLAAREADIIAIGVKWTGRGLDPTDASLEQKISWIKEASGERFADIELSQTIFDMMITDSKSIPGPQTGGPPAPKRALTTEQAVAQLIEQREQYGFSYLQIYAGQIENFAPVVARLAGN